MALGIYNSNAFKNASGVQVVASANVEVRRESDSGLASIFSDRAGTAGIAQVAYPGTTGFKADSNGYFEFFADGLDGGYQVRVYSDDLTLDKTVRYQPTGTARERDASSFGASLMGAADAPAARALLGGTAGAAVLAGETVDDVRDAAELGDFVNPGGRLTLTSGTPVTSADVSSATTVYYSPYKHNVVPLYDGSKWVPRVFSELSQATTDATKSPAAVAADSNYDVFVWNDGGTLRATRGPAWSSATARGTGAGTTELERFEGRYVNKVAITNGPAARRGLYVGTIRSDASSQINDTAALRHLWNNYNRVTRMMRVVDTTDSWNYGTAAWRQANGSGANQLDMVRGLDEDAVRITSVSLVSNNTATGRSVSSGIGLDSTTAFVGLPARHDCTNSLSINGTAEYVGLPGLGRHFLAWLEHGAGADTQLWIGDGGASFSSWTQCGIHGEVLA